MSPALLADAVLLLHAAFIVFVVLGGLACLRWPALVWLHAPAWLWGAWVELSGGVCPLTPLETRLRTAAGQAGYSGGFIEHHLQPLIYPTALTRDVQWLLGGALIALNLAVYAALLRRWRKDS